MQQQAEQHGGIPELDRAGDFAAAQSGMAASIDRTWLDDIDFYEELTDSKDEEAL